MRGTSRRILLSALLAAEVGCVTPFPSAPPALEPKAREVVVYRIRPPVINLHDRGVETLGVLAFDGPYGAELARDLSSQIVRRKAFGVFDPATMQERLMKAGLAVGWETAESSLRWVHERTAVQAVVVGRVETFRVEEEEQAKNTLTLEGTGEYGFVVTEEGKIAYREKMAYRPVPLFCRTDRGTVSARYRLWDVKRGEEAATVRHELEAEIPSFCYRGDVPERLKKQAQDRLLQKLFHRLNEKFVAQIVSESERRTVIFEDLSGAGDPVLVRQNELGLVYAARGKWDEATAIWNDCLAEWPEVPAIHYNLAMAHQAAGRLSLSLEHLKKAATLSPRPRYQRALMRIQEESGARRRSAVEGG